MCRNLDSARMVFVCLALLATHSDIAADDEYPDSTVRAGSSPSETLSAYFTTLEQQNQSPDLDIYTPATQRMLREWVTTAAQMNNLLSTYRRCHAEKARIDSRQRYAVIRYPVDERQCSPWFFEFVDGAWAMDLTMMQRAIRFGRDNAWRFDRGADHPYDFAFADWAFDSNGFPRER